MENEVLETLETVATTDEVTEVATQAVKKAPNAKVVGAGLLVAGGIAIGTIGTLIASKFVKPAIEKRKAKKAKEAVNPDAPVADVEATEVDTDA